MGGLRISISLLCSFSYVYVLLCLLTCHWFTQAYDATKQKASDVASAANHKGGEAVVAAEGAGNVVKDKAVEVSGAATDKAGQVHISCSHPV